MGALLDEEPDNLTFLGEMCDICIGCKDYKSALDYAEKIDQLLK